MTLNKIKYSWVIQAVFYSMKTHLVETQKPFETSIKLCRLTDSHLCKCLLQFRNFFFVSRIICIHIKYGITTIFFISNLLITFACPISGTRGCSGFVVAVCFTFDMRKVQLAAEYLEFSFLLSFPAFSFLIPIAVVISIIITTVR